MTSGPFIAESGTVVVVVESYGDDGSASIDIFSTSTKANAFVENDDRAHVIYDYVVDDPASADARHN